MTNNKGLVIILAIIAIAGLGLSSYMFTMDLLSEEEDPEQFGNLKLIALYSNLYVNTGSNPLHNSYDNFLVKFSDKIAFNDDYLTQSNTTRFSFTTLGIYKIYLNAILTDYEINSTYWVNLLVYDLEMDCFDRWETSDCGLR